MVPCGLTRGVGLAKRELLEAYDEATLDIMKRDYDASRKLIARSEPAFCRREL